jgi:SAM-dependent methyltransferase
VLATNDREEIEMTTMTTPEIDELKAAHRVTWAAGDYAAVAEALVLDVAASAVAAAELEPGSEVLDVATGSGNAAIPAAQAGARVTGLDLVPGLLEIAARRAAHAGVNVSWVEGDAEALPFEDARFDVALSVLGVQFAPRHRVSALELARVVRPGGRIVLASWTPQGFIGQLFATMSPYLPAPPAGVSPPPLWGDEAHLRSLFAGTGVRFESGSRSVLFEHDSPEGFIEFMADHYGPLVKAREKLSASGTWEGLRRELVALGERWNLAADSFVVPAEYLLARGRRES